MAKKYPGGRTFAQWRLLSEEDRRAWLIQEKCDRLGLWALCAEKRRCRRHRTCRGNQFDCYRQRRETMSAAERARADARCAVLDALLDGGFGAAP